MNRRMRPTAASSRNCRTAGVSARCGYRPTNNGVHRRHPTYNGTNGTPRRSTEPKHIGYGSIHRANRTKSGRPAPYRIPEHRADKDSIPLKIQATVSSLSEFADFRRLFHGRLRIENPSTETDLTPLDHAGSFGFPGNRHLVRRKMRNGTNQNFPYLTSRKIGIETPQDRCDTGNYRRSDTRSLRRIRPRERSIVHFLRGRADPHFPLRSC